MYLYCIINNTTKSRITLILTFWKANHHFDQAPRLSSYIALRPPWQLNMSYGFLNKACTITDHRPEASRLSTWQNNSAICTALFQLLNNFGYNTNRRHNPPVNTIPINSKGINAYSTGHPKSRIKDWLLCILICCKISQFHIDPTKRQYIQTGFEIPPSRHDQWCDWYDQPDHSPCAGSSLC